MKHTKNSFDCYGVVCHDSGAANQILPYLCRENYCQISGHFRGPAIKSHVEFFPNLKLKSSLEELVQSSTVLISGTGWASNLEHDARKLAKKYDKYCIAVIDHWVNYKGRFERLNEIIHPDEIWVFDNIAFQKSRKLFPNILISQKKSIYEELLVSRIKNYYASHDEILYICEPLRKSSEAGKPLEIDILRTVLEKIMNDEMLRGHTLRLRLHPSEVEDKYDSVISEFSSLNIVKDNGDLSFAIGNAKLIIGCSSYALYIAYLAGKQVISAMPESVEPIAFDMRQIIPIGTL